MKNFVLKIFLLTALVLIADRPAYAELRVSIKPDAITAASSSAVVIEASSLKLDITIARPDVAMHAGDPEKAIARILGDAPLYDETSARRTLATHYSLGLHDLSTPALTAGKSTSDWQRHPNLFQVVDGITKHRWRGEKDGGPPLGPPPDMVFVIELDLPTALLVEKALDDASAQVIAENAPISIVGFHRLARGWMQRAMNAARVEEVHISSDGRFINQPVAPTARTALGWLYQATLDLTSRDTVAARANVMSGCNLSVANLVTRLVPDPDSVRSSNPIEVFYQDMIGRDLSQFRTLVWLSSAARDGTVAGWVAEHASRAGIFIAPDLLIQFGVALVAGPIAGWSDYRTALANGRIDPIVSDVYHCAGILRARGHTMLSASIFERSLGYRAAQDALIKKAGAGNPYPRFFSAAEAVTKLLGIGMVDPLELHDADRFKALFDTVDEVFVDEDCAGLTGAESLMVSRRARQILQTINWELYHNVNLPIITYLLTEERYPRPFQLRDPVSERTITRDMHPMFSGMRDTPLPFDLRMVLAEQGYIRDRLPELIDIGSAEGRGISAELTRTQQALYCLQTSLILRSEQDQSHRDYLSKTKTYLNAALEAGLFDPEERVFGNYWWRVATGSAMVMIVHGRSENEFVDYLRTLMALQSRVAPEAAAAVLKPGDLERVDALMRQERGSLSPADVQEVRRAARILLSPTFGEDLFWGCSGLPDQSVIQNPMGKQDRALTVTSSGGMSLVLALELGQGGALDADASPDASNPGVCPAINSRRERLGSWVMRGEDSPITSYWTESKHIVVFDGGRRLRSLIGTLAPYLRVQRTAGAPLSLEADWVLDRVAEARERQAGFERRLTLLRMLEPYNDDELGALGIAAAEFRALAERVRQARPNLSGSLGEDGDKYAYSELYGAAGADSFLRDFEVPLEDLFDFLENSWAAGSDGPNPVRLPEDRFAKNDFFLTPSTTAPQGGVGLGDKFLGGMSVGGVVGLSLEDAGTFADGSRRLAGTLSVRLPELRSPGPAGATADCDIVNTTYSLTGEVETTGSECVTNSILGDQDTATAADLASLGVRFTRLKLPDDCDAADLAECWLLLEEIDDADTIRPNQQTLTDTLRRLGMPRFVSFSLDEVVFGDDRSTRDIELIGDLTVASVPLGQVNLKLRENGEWQELFPKLIEAAETKINENMSQKLAKIEAFMASLRLPADPGSYAEAPVRFGPVLTADGSPDIAIALDWERPSLGFRALYELSARLPDEPAASAVAVRAGVELSLGATGLEMQRIVFETPGMEEVNKRIAGLFSDVSEALGGSIDVAPEVRGGDLHLRLAFQKEIEGCPIEAAVSIPFQDLFADSSEATLREAADAVLAQATTCLAEPLTAAVDTALQSQTLDVLGVPFVVSSGAFAIQEAIDGQLPLVFTLADGATGEGAPLGVCTGLPARSVEGIRLKADSGLKLDFRQMHDNDQNTLGRMLSCRIETVTPEALRPHFELRGLAVGHDLVAADLALKDLPMVGTVVLPRQNFLHLDRDIGDLLIDALGAAASQALTERIEKQVSELEVPGIGKVSMVAGTMALDLFGPTPSLTADIRIEAYGIAIPGSLELRLDRGLDAMRIQIDEDAAMTAAVEGAVAKLLEFVPEDTVKIENPRFGRLDDLGREWGLVFGVKAKVPIEPGLIVGASRVVISEGGVKLGEKITGGVSTPIYLGIVALSRTLISLYTGEDGGKSGIEIGADLTVFEPQLAHLIKLRALLDLSEIDKPKFTATGDLVVLSALEIFKSKGVLDLSQVRATLDAETTDAIRDILDFRIALDLDGGEQRFLAKSQLGVLGIDLSRTDVAFCVKACGDGSEREHLAEVTVEENLLIGKGLMHAVTDLDFKDPQIGAGIGLNLFGWKPGSARFDADLRRVQVALKFLGIKVKAVTPSIETMTPQYLIDLLKALFDISLEDLLKIDPTDISVSVMSGDGSTQSVHEGDADSEASAQADNGQDNPGDNVGTGTTPADLEETGSPPPEGDGRGAPEQTPWGQTVFANICEKVIGTPGLNTISDELDARFYVHSVREQAEIVPAFRWPIEPPGKSWPWWRLYTESSTAELCQLVGSAYQLHKTIVGTDRRYASWRRCDSLEPPSFSYTPIAGVAPGQTRSEPLEGAINLSTHLACAEVDGWSLAIWGDWFYEQATEGSPSRYLIAPRCPSGDVLEKAIAASPEIATLCQDAGLLKVVSGDAGSGYPVPDLVSAERVYQLTVTGLAPLVEGHGEQRNMKLDTSFSVPDVVGSEDRVYIVEPWTERNAAGELLNWHLMMRNRAAEGRVDVIPLVLTANDPLMRYSARPKILAKVLGFWLANGRRPEILSPPNDHYLVLGTSADQAARSERQLWLWQAGPETALIEREIEFPLQLPANGGFLRMSAGATPAKEIILDSVWEEVRRLPPSTMGWKVVAGIDPRKGTQSWAFYDLDANGEPGQTIHLLLDRVVSKNLAIDVLWNATFAENETVVETAEMRATRRRCTTRGEISAALGSVQVPPRDAVAMLAEGAVDLALTDPPGFDRTYRGLRALPDPLVRLPDDSCPGAFE